MVASSMAGHVLEQRATPVRSFVLNLNRDRWFDHGDCSKPPIPGVQGMCLVPCGDFSDVFFSPNVILAPPPRWR